MPRLLFRPNGSVLFMTSRSDLGMPRLLSNQVFLHRIVFVFFVFFDFWSCDFSCFFLYFQIYAPIPIGWVKRFAPHQCGPLAASTLEEEDAGATSLQALVNMSAAWSSVLMYSIRAESSLKISDRQDRFTLCVLVLWRSLGLYPFFTTRIVA